MGHGIWNSLRLSILTATVVVCPGLFGRSVAVPLATWPKAPLPITFSTFTWLLATSQELVDWWRIVCCLFLSHSVEKKLEVCRMEISVLNFMQRSHKSYINLSSRKLARTPLSNTTVRDADFLVGTRVNCIAYTRLFSSLLCVIH